MGHNYNMGNITVTKKIFTFKIFEETHYFKIKMYNNISIIDNITIPSLLR